MKVVESPNTYSPDPEARRLYLAGGITGCPDWQQEMVHLLAQTELVIFNPRRQHFPIDDPSAAEEQIRWEHHHLRLASDKRVTPNDSARIEDSPWLTKFCVRSKTILPRSQ